MAEQPFQAGLFTCLMRREGFSQDFAEDSENFSKDFTLEIQTQCQGAWPS